MWFLKLLDMVPDKLWDILKEVLKWVVLATSLGVAFWYIDHTADTRGYDRGVLDTTAKYKDMQNAETTKTTTQDRTVRQFIYRKTDADLQRVLDFWMLPDSEGTNSGR